MLQKQTKQILQNVYIRFFVRTRGYIAAANAEATGAATGEAIVVETAAAAAAAASASATFFGCRNYCYVL